MNLPWEGNHVDSEFPKISVQLTRETKAGGDSRHGGGYEMVKISVCGCGQLQGSEADIVKGLVVNTVGLVGVFYELMNTEGGVVWFYNSV